MPARAPNYVVVFMDDMGYGDMGCYGSPAIRTPHMDALAAQGARFTQMYSAAPICTPSRCALLTGRYAQRVGLPRVLFPKDEHGLGADELTIAGALKPAGYRSACLGKWHLGCREAHYPTRHGFDHYFGLLYSNDMTPLHLYRNEEVLEREVDQATLTGRYTDEAIDFITRHKDEPFFVYLAHTMPHIPLYVEEAFRGKSRAGTYGDTIECIDHHLGRLMETLDTLGLADDTLLIVTSDNGPWFEGSPGPFRGRKFDVYEGGIRMPFVARWPKAIPAGSVHEGLACLFDLLPTFLEESGVPAGGAHRLDGVSLSRALRGQGAAEREALYHYCMDALNAVRVGKWKLHVAKSGDGKDRKEMPQLFDMELDPGENYNLKDNFPEVVARLRGMMEAFDAQVTAEREAKGVPKALTLDSTGG